jgi:HD-GYP domain-containing protein (c-di-GMP phosphodiesterase class II)
VGELVRLADNAMYAAKRERSHEATLSGRPLADQRAARMVGEMVPMLTSQGDLEDKLRLVSRKLSVGAGYDAVNFLITGGTRVANVFARLPERDLRAWSNDQKQNGADHPVRVLLRRTRRPLIMHDIEHEEGITDRQRTMLMTAGLKSALVAPMFWREELVGVLSVASKRENAFGPSDAAFLMAVATQVTAIVRMSTLVEELQSATQRLAASQAETVMMLAAAAEAHDRTTGLHLTSIRSLAEALARELGYEEERVAELGLAAVLHDIGKVSVPDTVLSSSGALLGEDWEQMKQHTVWGAEFLSGRPGFDLAASVARWHHERWDGAGYPDGLRDGQIPEAAAIVTVADSFDAMTHDRPYKAGRSLELAIEEIKACAGTQFNPRVVEALVALHERGELAQHALHDHDHPEDEEQRAA